MHTWYLISILLGLILLLFIDHYIKHGYFYDIKDFENATYKLFKSHEGLIVVLVLLIIGILLNDVGGKIEHGT